MGLLNAGWSITEREVKYPSTVNPWRAYKFVQEAIVDGHIPTTRVIGYFMSMSNKVKSVRGSRILERSMSCAEDGMTLAKNLSELLVCDYSVPRMIVDAKKEVVTLNNAVFQYSKRNIKVLYPRDRIFTSIEPATLQMVLNADVGIRGADYNYNVLRKTTATTTSNVTRYFPIFSHHDLVDYVRVLPFDGQKINIRMRNGMTADILSDMFEQLFTRTIDDPWRGNYEEILK